MAWELVAEERRVSGKGAARKLRRMDKIPGVVYGPAVDKPLPVIVPGNKLKKLIYEFGEETKVVDLVIKQVDGGERREQVIIKDIQVHPYRRMLLHADFYALAADQDVDVDVPVEIVGEAKGVKKGGVLNVVLHSLLIRCLPKDIPEKIEVDVSELDIGDVIHVEDIKDRFSFKILSAMDAPIVAVTPPEGEEAPAEGESEEEGGEASGE
ncbi:50S ribosomal protein L25/general stress protein Ctc [Thermodesulforhabdus norvegica]|uniref:Large ribosomal subunit protein bL25 n=1 Tax=Thermodesulforhabdus norvegica TaxID=39841 RepID=A0A1I4UR40_9BACT|nr:50S ribosomal protein L25/general stress protein Ctc [Thermodesulforhabdus norvegica]SFM91432.1 large subunit ribosomal protein L25 [Thermodesulforhabdus norvegica]